LAGRSRKRRLAAAAAKRPREGAGSTPIADTRRDLLALRVTHPGAEQLRSKAVRELSRQHGNHFVQRSLEGAAPITASPVVVAREEAEGESAVKITDTPTHSTYTVTGKTLAQAFASIQAYASKHSGEAGSVKWAPSWVITYGEDGYATGVKVTARIVKTMPSWKDAENLSTAAKAEWDRVYKELDDHENRHLEILTNGATYIGNSALGSSKKDAEKAAHDAKNSINADNVAIDPFDTVMTTDIK
jgi:predicted secreted Zn-dependent protease